MKGRNHETSHYAVFFSLLNYSPLLGLNIHLRIPILKNLQPISLMFFSRPSFTPINKNRQNYNCVHSNLMLLYTKQNYTYSCKEKETDSANKGVAN